MGPSLANREWGDAVARNSRGDEGGEVLIKRIAVVNRVTSKLGVGRVVASTVRQDPMDLFPGQADAGHGSGYIGSASLLVASCEVTVVVEASIGRRGEIRRHVAWPRSDIVLACACWTTASSSSSWNGPPDVIVP